MTRKRPTYRSSGDVRPHYSLGASGKPSAHRRGVSITLSPSVLNTPLTEHIPWPDRDMDAAVQYAKEQLKARRMFKVAVVRGYEGGSLKEITITRKDL